MDGSHISDVIKLLPLSTSRLYILHFSGLYTRLRKVTIETLALVVRGAGAWAGLTLIGSSEPIAGLGFDLRATGGQGTQLITMMDYELAINGSREFHYIVGNRAYWSYRALHPEIYRLMYCIPENIVRRLIVELLVKNIRAEQTQERHGTFDEDQNIETNMTVTVQFQKEGKTNWWWALKCSRHFDRRTGAEPTVVKWPDSEVHGNSSEYFTLFLISFIV